MLAVCSACRGGAAGESAAPPELLPVPEVHRNEDSGIEPARSWIVATEAGWDSLWAQTTGGGRWSGPRPVVDFSREMLVAVAGGDGTPESPMLSLDGYSLARDTMAIHVRVTTSGARCPRSDLLARPLLVGRVPRHHGVVQVIERRVATPC